jgi:ankyrin repeat protein
VYKDIFDAAANGSVDDVRFFLERGVDINVKIGNDKTPFDLASSEEKQIVLREAGGKSGNELH